MFKRLLNLFRKEQVTLDIESLFDAKAWRAEMKAEDDKILTVVVTESRSNGVIYFAPEDASAQDKADDKWGMNPKHFNPKAWEQKVYWDLVSDKNKEPGNE